MPVIHVVAALLVDAEGRMCLVRKRGTEAFMQPGGKPEPGETAPQALARELAEELGLAVDPGAFDPLGRFTAAAANEPGHEVRADVFRLVTDRRPGAHAEIAEVRWAGADEALALGGRLAPLARRLLPLAAADPARARLRDAYDGIAAAYAASLPDASFEAPLERGMLDRFVRGLPPGSRVLDAGCGSGRMLAHLGALRPDLVLAGIDLSPAMVGLAREAAPSADIGVGDLAALPFADGSFDAVLAWYSLIHVATAALRGPLGELRRVLAPGGAVLAAFQAGTGSRSVTTLALDAPLHEPAAVEAAMRAVGLTPRARARRGPREGERVDQAAVLAERL